MEQVITPPASLGTIASAIAEASCGFTIQSREQVYIPIDPLAVGDVAEGEAGGISEDRAEALDKVVGMLEEEADVVRVWTNLA